MNEREKKEQEIVSKYKSDLYNNEQEIEVFYRKELELEKREQQEEIQAEKRR